MMDFHIQSRVLIKVEWLRSADCHAQGVADEVAIVMVFDERGIFRKHRTLGGIFHVIFQGHQPFFTRLVEQLVHHLESFEIDRLAEFRAAQRPDDSAHDLLENVQRICNQHGADRRAPR